MKNENYYDILNISRNASHVEVKRAYYTLCKKYHPDINPSAVDIFKQINQAYEVLSNPIKRREYNAKLDNPQEESMDNNTDYAYDDYSAYQYNPDNDPIIVILNNVNKYKTENVTSAIWKRNVFVLLGNTIYLALLPIFSLLHLLSIKVLAKSLISPNLRKIKWLNNLHIRIEEQSYIKYLVFGIILACFTISKTIYHTFKIIMFIYHKIVKPLLIPMSIILASLILNSKQKHKTLF